MALIGGTRWFWAASLTVHAVWTASFEPGGVLYGERDDAVGVEGGPCYQGARIESAIVSISFAMAQRRNSRLRCSTAGSGLISIVTEKL